MKNNNELYSIGEISKLCHIPIKTIRYYDEIGLLKPTSIDSDTSYRYYSLERALKIMIIKEYRSLGFPLKKIELLMKQGNLSLLVNEMEKQLNDVQKEMKSLIQRRNKISRLIKQVKAHSFLPQKRTKNINEDELEIKKISKFKVMYIRYRGVHNQNHFIKRYSQLINLVNQNNLYRTGPLMAIFYDHYKKYDYNNADIEVCVPIAGTIDDCPNVREYGGFTAVTCIHFGSYEHLIQSYKKAMSFIKNNQYEYVVPTTERYIIDAGYTNIEEKFVTEIILPVKNS